MKKITLLLTLLLCFMVNAQESYPAKHPELLKDKKVKVINTSFSDSYGYQDFYTDEAMKTKYRPAVKFENYTAKEALSGKTFTVTNISPEK